MKDKTRKLPPFVALTWEMLNHKAYIELPASAKGMLPYFIGKVRATVREPAHYTTSFTFPYAEAERYGCATRTFYKVLQDLITQGFVDPVEKGGLRGAGLTSSTFRLSARWKKYGTTSFERVTWGQFGQHQIRRQLQNMHCIAAENTVDKGANHA